MGSGAEIVALRERDGVSQAVLARCLNVTTNTISQIERGAKRPGGSTLKLLSLIKAKGLEAILEGCWRAAHAVSAGRPAADDSERSANRERRRDGP
jgi:transcriptional regulator with XRE-family HTH domain